MADTGTAAPTTARVNNPNKMARRAAFDPTVETDKPQDYYDRIKEKFAEEGQFEICRRIYGLGYNSRKETASLSPVKLAKMAHVLSDPRLDPGTHMVKVKVLHIWRGNVTFWLYVNPWLDAEVGAIDRLLSQVAPGCPYAVFKVSAAEAGHMMEDLWDMVEFCRLTIGGSSKWASSFVCSLKGILQPL